MSARHPKFSSLHASLAVAMALQGCSKAAPGEPVRVAAAADLASAFEEVGARFAEKTGQTPAFTFGSTGLLAKQLNQGAPFDLFAAANVSFVDDTVRAGACDGTTRALYGRGRIVLWWNESLGVAPPRSLADLADERFHHVAIANPEHAPYGKAAVQAMEHAGISEAMKGKLVYGENVLQTLQFAKSGNAEVAVIALSLALSSADAGDYLPIDESAYAPIDQALVVCKNGHQSVAGKRFAEFVNGAEGRAIMKRHGFLLPGERLATAR